MTNPNISPQPNYSGVTIQISNPAVNVNPHSPYCNCPNYVTNPMGFDNNTYNKVENITTPAQDIQNPEATGVNPNVQIVPPSTNPQNSTYNTQNPTGYANAYPPQYYLNNYNIQNLPNSQPNAVINPQNNSELTGEQNIQQIPENVISDPNAGAGIANKYSAYANTAGMPEEDLTKSQNIINDISEREAILAEEKKNTKETKIVALTDDYIKSLEAYLNNPNQEIRLMASKEILTRLDEDKDRYNDAALNALLNKMMQDPSKLIRITALSAFASGLASGNDYTVKLLQDIQSNPNADKEDALQAANILLKMSSETETKNVPIEEYEARAKARLDAKQEAKMRARLEAEAEAKVKAEAKMKAKAEADAMAKLEAEEQTKNKKQS